MNLVDALLDIGAESKEVLNDLPGGTALTALEVVRHAACTGAQSILQDPPPVLYHESKIHSTSLLYASQLPPPVQQGPHRHITAGEIRDQYSSEGVACVGGLMMDITQRESVPVCIVVERCEERREIAVCVDAYGVPIAQLEVELFSDVPPGAFERKWLDDLAQDAVTFRSGTGKYIQSKGYNQMPGWVWSDEYMSERDGPLPLLRLRRPNCQADATEIEKLVSAVGTYCHSGITTMKNIVEPSFRSEEGSPAEEWKFRVSTRFFAAELPPPDGPVATTIDVSKLPTMGILSLLLLKRVSNTDYYDMSEHLLEERDAENQEEAAQPSGDVCVGTGADGAEPLDPNDPLSGLGPAAAMDARDEAAVFRVAAVLSEREAELFAELRAGNADGTAWGHTTWARSERGAMDIAERTGRPCGTVHLQRSPSALLRAKAICKQAFPDAEYDFLAHCLDNESSRRGDHAEGSHLPESFDALLESVGLALGSRFAMLAMHQNGDGEVTRCTLAAHDGCHGVTRDCAVRLLLAPWVFPVVIKSNEVATVQVAGVSREALRLSTDKAQEACRWRMHPGEEALEALRQLPGLLRKLGSLPGSTEPSAPPDQCYAEAGRGFKRARACLEAYRVSMDQCANGGA